MSGSKGLLGSRYETCIVAVLNSLAYRSPTSNPFDGSTGSFESCFQAEGKSLCEKGQALKRNLNQCLCVLVDHGLE